LPLLKFQPSYIYLRARSVAATPIFRAYSTLQRETERERDRERESKLHRNPDNHTQNYTASLPRILQHSTSWEANSSTASQEIPRILWNRNVHCRVHNSRHLSPSSARMPQNADCLG